MSNFKKLSREEMRKVAGGNVGCDCKSDCPANGCPGKQDCQEFACMGSSPTCYYSTCVGKI